MNIFSSLKNLFINKSSTAEPQTTKQSDKNSITFSIDGFGRSWVALELNNKDTKSCEDFAKMLFDINNSNYEQATLDLMVSLSKQKPLMAPTLETILISWGMMLATGPINDEHKVTKNTENRPFIRPRNVFLGKDK
jgi:hypothetical protein